MRIDVSVIVTEANNLLAAIQVKSLSRSARAAHHLLVLMPSPIWAETAPGLSIYYHGEQEATLRINALRRHVMRWMDWLTETDVSHEDDDEWPAPTKLALATQKLAELNQNASVSANTAPVTS